MKLKLKQVHSHVTVILVILCAILIVSFLPKASKDVGMVTVVVPEGLASSDIARVIKQNIPSFDSEQFAILAKPYEGYLFPDTYSFSPTTTPEEVIEKMRKNFDSQTRLIKLFSALQGKSFKDVLIVASLVEEESNSSTDRRLISGVIWKRLSIGMPLQLDAPFFYLLGKASHELTYGDLAMDSPYNLYKNKGLPPTPIDNPSLESILAALHPVKTDYLYFLSDSTGDTYFSLTFEEHMAKRREYIE